MNITKTFSTQLLYTDFCRAGREWNYKNIVSPFTRVYLITGGKGAIYINQVRHELKAGELIIIPKFTNHSYECSDFIEHYYICFFDEMIGQRSIFDIVELRHQLKATELDVLLFKRILDINSEMSVPHHDPRTYNNRKESLQFNSFNSIMDILNNTESGGIIMQILSRFFNGCKVKTSSEMEGSYYRLTALINHINNNLSSPLKIYDLAEYMCLSPDHFTRIFKRIMGTSAKEYIQNKRVERAQSLLITARFSIQEVANSVGIPNISQFSTLFKKITHLSPRQYLKEQIAIMQQNSPQDDAARVDKSYVHP
ncbi:MAG: AraC family transcriptional regulator [Rikenellaceae bacterium]